MHDGGEATPTMGVTEGSHTHPGEGKEEGSMSATPPRGRRSAAAPRPRRGGSGAVAAVTGLRGRLRRVRLRLHLLPGGQQTLQPGAGRDLRVRAARPWVPFHQRAGGAGEKGGPGKAGRGTEPDGAVACPFFVFLFSPTRFATTPPSPPATPSLTTSSSGKVGAEEGVGMGGGGDTHKRGGRGGSHLLPPHPPRHEVEEQILGQVPGDRPHGHRQRAAAQVRPWPRKVAPHHPPPPPRPGHRPALPPPADGAAVPAGPGTTSSGTR